MKTKVKICSITNIEDALMAADYGADFLGFLFTKSKRQIQPCIAKHIIGNINNLVTTVGVFMNDSFEFIQEVIGKVQIDMVQLHGKEAPEFCQKINKPIIKRIHVANQDTTESLICKMKPYSVSVFLLDPGAGSGKTFDWNIAKGIDLPLMIAGGLNPENVSEVVEMLNPYAVDVSSGVEKAIGKKDTEKVKRFIEEVK